MVSDQEKIARIREFFKFNPQEITGLIAAILVTSFIFSFRDWGATSFDLIVGLKNFFLVFVATAITFLARISAQKILGLEEGYLAEFKVWFAGLGIALAIVFISRGWVPLILVGAMVNRFMVKHRLGELRYGFSYADNAAIANRGIIVNLGLATIFSILLYLFPGHFFLTKVVLLNLVMAASSLLPLPQLDGLSIFFGGRTIYYSLILVTVLCWILLLTRTKLGIIIATIILIAIVSFNKIRSSEK